MLAQGCFLISPGKALFLTECWLRLITKRKRLWNLVSLAPSGLLFTDAILQLPWITWSQIQDPRVRWGLWNTGMSYQHPSLRLLLSIFSRNCWRKFGQKSFPIAPSDWTLISSFLYPQPHPTCKPQINSLHLYMLPNSLLYICGFFRFLS